MLVNLRLLMKGLRHCKPDKDYMSEFPISAEQFKAFLELTQKQAIKFHISLKYRIMLE